MKKLFLLGCFAIAAMTVSAESKKDVVNTPIDVDSIMYITEKESNFERITPKYLTNYYTTGWGDNWFVGVQGGASAYIGNPKGCGDLFDRTSMTWNAYIGKWHNPFIGNRIVYHGGKFKDMFMNKQTFNAVHADLLYNVTNHLMTENQTLRRWDIIPYVGMGLIHGPRHSHTDCPCDACNSRNLGFMVAYGIQGRYRVSDRAYVTAEFGGMHTFDDFDNHGSRQKFSDGMLSLSVGLSVNIGKNGWKHPVDAKPYMSQNGHLVNSIGRLTDANHALYNQYQMDESTINELRKVIMEEGLWGQYGYLFKDKARDKRSYYDGLMSLRARLRADRMRNNEQEFDSIASKNIFPNVPIYFFFELGTDKLTDKSQLVNLDEIAQVVKEQNIVIRIDGAADKATGSKKINEDLSRKRARYIWLELKKRGVDTHLMKAFWHGGVDEHDRNEEDRNTHVSVYKR